MLVVKGEAPSLGWLPVPHSRHSTVELAIGTCRHHLPMVASGATRANVKVPPLAPNSGRWFDIQRWAILDEPQAPARSACGQGGGGPMPAIDARTASARS